MIDPFGWLSDALQARIFSYLNGIDLFRAVRVNKTWRKLNFQRYAVEYEKGKWASKRELFYHMRSSLNIRLRGAEFISETTHTIFQFYLAVHPVQLGHSVGLVLTTNQWKDSEWVPAEWEENFQNEEFWLVRFYFRNVIDSSADKVWFAFYVEDGAGVRVWNNNNGWNYELGFKGVTGRNEDEDEEAVSEKPKEQEIDDFISLLEQKEEEGVIPVAREVAPRKRGATASTYVGVASMAKGPASMLFGQPPFKPAETSATPPTPTLSLGVPTTSTTPKNNQEMAAELFDMLSNLDVLVPEKNLHSGKPSVETKMTVPIVITTTPTITTKTTTTTTTPTLEMGSSDVDDLLSNLGDLIPKSTETKMTVATTTTTTTRTTPALAFEMDNSEVDDLLSGLSDLGDFTPKPDDSIVTAIQQPPKASQDQLEMLDMLAQLDDLSSIGTSEEGVGGFGLQLSDLDNTLKKLTQLHSAPMQRAPQSVGTLVKDWYVREEMNENGMLKGKKTTWITTADGKRLEVIQMEDASYVGAPFDGNVGFATFCVFDGHGGKRAALAAQDLFPKILREELQKNGGHFVPQKSHIAIYESLDGAMGTHTEKDPKKKIETKKYDCEGCTATTAVIYESNGKRFLSVANVGDSAAVLCRGNKAIQLTPDHKVTEPAERKRLLDMGVKLNANSRRIPAIGLAVSRALGDFFAKEVNSGLIGVPDVAELELTEEDRYLIVASDGLWDVITPVEAYKLARQCADAEEIVNLFIAKAIDPEAKNSDNVTVIAIVL